VESQAKTERTGIATARDFHALYGEFFAIWKLWRYSHHHSVTARAILLLEITSNKWEQYAVGHYRDD